MSIEIPPCANCKTPYPASLAAEYAASIESLRAVNPELADSCLRTEYLCDVCMAKHIYMSDAQRHAERIRRLTDKTYPKNEAETRYIPLGAKEHTFTNSGVWAEERNPQAWIAAKAPITNVWIKGEPGTGKTFMARCIANRELTNKGRTISEITAIALNTIAGQWEAEKLLAPYRDSHVLILDDIDKTEWSAKGIEALWVMLNYRVEKRTHLIVTANTTGKHWAEVMKGKGTNASMIASIMERMKPMTGIELTGKSLRHCEIQNNTAYKTSEDNDDVE